MDRQTILKPTPCDVKRLPLGALEAFVLSQLDGRLTLEEIAEIAGLELREAERLAERFVELGAASTHESRLLQSKPRGGPVSVRTTTTEERAPPSRVDPRAETTSLRPDPRAEKSSLRPASMKPPAKQPTKHPPKNPTKHPPKSPTVRPPRARSRKSLQMQRPDEACDLDEATVAAIAALDAKLGTVDHYALLGVERTAEKKAIKRAYFGFAARFHPDRFFGKKLGTSRARIDRVFHRLTEAHDTLTDPARRATYDAALPPVAPAAVRKMSKAMKAVSRQLEAVTAPAPASAPARASVPARAPAPSEQPAPPRRSSLKPPPPSTEEKKNRLRTGVTELMLQKRIDLFVKAAEEALEKNDVAGAANHLRLALEHREDARIRVMFEDVDARARTLRFEKNIGPARGAERDQRWGDAAVFLVRAHEAKPDCDVAARAAHALRLSGGDLGRATALAEQAVELAPKNAAYRVTLAEVHLAAGRIEHAQDEHAIARTLAPKDASVKALAEAIAKQSKAKAATD